MVVNMCHFYEIVISWKFNHDGLGNPIRVLIKGNVIGILLWHCSMYRKILLIWYVENLGRIVTMRMHEESYDAVIPCVIVCCIKEEWYGKFDYMWHGAMQGMLWDNALGI